MIMDKSTNVVWHHATVTRERREGLNNHKGALIWFTGLSGAGKSTLAHAVEEELHQRGCRTLVLDGDNVRHGLCGDLGFSEVDRSENLRRIGEEGKLMVEAGVITLAAFISPTRVDRQRVRSLLPHGDFLEVYCDCALAVCESRDVKGLYAQARAGEIEHFTGISAPYEVPKKADLLVPTDGEPLQQSVARVVQLLEQRTIIPAKMGDDPK